MTRSFTLCLLLAVGITTSPQVARADEPLAIKFDGPAPGADKPQTSPDSPEAGKLRVSGSYTAPENATLKGVVVRYKVKGGKSWEVLNAKVDDERNWTACKSKLPAGVYEVQVRVAVNVPGVEGDREVFADRDGTREVTIR